MNVSKRCPSDFGPLCRISFLSRDTTLTAWGSPVAETGSSGCTPNGLVRGQPKPLNLQHNSQCV